MIRIFYGTPGAGKSYGTLKDLIEELAYGLRLIVTNLSVDFGRLNALLQKRYPQIDFGDINHRIRIITEEQTRQFYAFRSTAAPQLTVPCKEDSLSGRHTAYPPRDPTGALGMDGVCYYIDEAHIAFDAREWGTTGPELSYYASQHRKLNDECVFITQHPDMLERRLRMLAGQFWSFQNNGVRRFLTFFQQPAYFTCEIHLKVPTGPQSPPADSTLRYRLDKEIADCYDTSAGIGISGRKMPEKKQKKGLPIYWLLVPLYEGLSRH